MTMMIKTSIFLAAILFLSSTRSVSGLGISCSGSGDEKDFCSDASDYYSEDGLFGSIVGAFSSSIGFNIDRDRFFNNGEAIACLQVTEVGPFGIQICAFLQNSGGAPGSSIVPLVQGLFDNECDTCGSVPLLFPRDNDVNDGELTINTVPYDFLNACGFDTVREVVMC